MLVHLIEGAAKRKAAMHEKNINFKIIGRVIRRESVWVIMY